MDEVQRYAEFNSTATMLTVTVQQSRFVPSECAIMAGSQAIHLSVADARALIDGLMAFTEGPE